MIRNEEFAKVRQRVQKVASGEYLVSDTVANHVADLMDSIDKFPYRPDEWKTAMELAPREAVIVEEWIDELVFLTEEIEAHQTGRQTHPTVINPARTLSDEEVR